MIQLDSQNTNLETSAFIPTKEKETFRNYDNSETQDYVVRSYRNSHTLQTFDYASRKLHQYKQLATGKTMSVWEAAELLNTIVDESDPDSNIPQINHLLQTAEAIRKVYPDPKYDWFHLTGFIHDLGKILLNPMFDEPQWAVVGDTFPVGCRFDESNIFYEFFKDNPDYNHPTYSTECGVYEPNCGLDKVVMSWGHDEYFYQVCLGNNCTLPPEALYVIRFHSFYPWHRQGKYKNITNDQDEEMLKWVKEFNLLFALGFQDPSNRRFIEFYTFYMREVKENVKDKALELVETWGLAFQYRSDIQAYYESYSFLKRNGYKFPPKRPDAIVLNFNKGKDKRPVSQAPSQSQHAPTHGQSSHHPSTASSGGNGGKLNLHQEIASIKGSLSLFVEMVSFLKVEEEDPAENGLLQELFTYATENQKKVKELIENGSASEKELEVLLGLNDEIFRAFTDYDGAITRRKQFVANGYKPVPLPPTSITTTCKLIQPKYFIEPICSTTRCWIQPIDTGIIPATNSQIYTTSFGCIVTTTTTNCSTISPSTSTTIQE
eukprot:gene3622-4150_t